MANFKAWVELTKAGNYLVRHRDGKTKLPTGRWKTFTDYTVEKMQTMSIDGKIVTGKWLANALAGKVEEKFFKNELGYVAVNEPLLPLIEKYIVDCERQGLAWNTVEQYDGNLRRFVSQYGFVMLSDLTNEHVNTFKENVQDQWEPSTIHKKIMNLFCFTSWLVEHKYLKTWPFAKKLLPKLKERTPKFYTLAEWLSLDLALESECAQTRLGCHLAYYAGLRKVEVAGDGRERVGVLWEDLTWNPDGSVDLMIRKEVAKGQRRAREVRLAPEIVDLLGSRKTGPLLTITRNQFTHRFIKARKAAGIKLDLTIHGQRHSFAKNYLEDGDMDLAALKEMMGHADIQTTQIYSAHEKSHLAKGIEKAYKTRQTARALLRLAGHRMVKSEEIMIMPDGKSESKRVNSPSDGL